jgi:hypothetical protein
LARNPAVVPTGQALFALVLKHYDALAAELDNL